MFTLQARDWFHHDAFPIAVGQSDMPASATVSSGHFSQVLIILSGRASYANGGDIWPVTAGDVFVVGRHEALACREIKDFRLINSLSHTTAPAEVALRSCVRIDQANARCKGS
jgi:hypothetical protein